MIRYTRKKSIRLQNYNYAQNGLYFITICSKNSKHLFGNISHGKMRLNRAGEMVERIWSEIPQFYDGFVLHDFVVMPIILKSKYFIGHRNTDNHGGIVPNANDLRDINKREAKIRRKKDE